MPNSTDPTKPDYTRPEVLAAARDLTIIAQLQGGPRAMWDASAQHIRKWRDEEETVYTIRRLCEPCEGLFTRTLSAAVGKLFAEPPVLTIPTAEDEFRAHWDNIDGTGKKGDVAIKEFAADAIADGYALILVDHPAAPGVLVTAANEQALGLRPVWAFYAREAVTSWRVETVNNAEILTQLVLRETSEVPHGAFGVGTLVQYRELYVAGGIAGWRLWQAPEKTGGDFSLVAEGVFRNRKGQTRDTIPLAIGYAGRTSAPLVAAPPLRDVAYLNLAHWQVATELTFGTQVSAIEQPVLTGEVPQENGDKGKVMLGWLKLVNVGQGGSFSWEGPSGAGLNQLLARKIEKEQAIAKMGLSFLNRDTRAAETAEAHRLDAAAEDSTLATAGQAIEDAVNQALASHAWYMGLAASDAPTIAINRDFEREGLSPQMVGAIGALLKEGMPVRTAVGILAQGGIIPTTDEAELDALALEWDSGRAALEDAQAMEAEPRMQPPMRPPMQEAA